MAQKNCRRYPVIILLGLILDPRMPGPLRLGWLASKGRNRVLPDRWGSIAFGWPSESLPIAAVCDRLARTCKIFRNTRPRLASTGRGAGQPTPFTGRQVAVGLHSDE